MRWFFLLLISASAVWAQPLVTVETVYVGDAGNLASSDNYPPEGLGSVSYAFGIGKYEMTISQYTVFLNSVAKSDPYRLYNINMARTNLAIDTDLGALIQRSGTSGNFTYTAVGSAARPIAFVSWFDAARFCNWLHNGATNGASTETGAYTLDGATNGVVTKNTNATWWIPSGDEWFKAAYYKKGGSDAGYWTYPTASDLEPGAPTYPPGSPNSANYRDAHRSRTTKSEKLTDVGAYLSSPSPYGTFDQGGNLTEWNDKVVNRSFRGLWGGTYRDDPAYISSRVVNTVAYPTDEYWSTGFRVATSTMLPPAAYIFVEQPSGTVLVNNAAALSQLTALVGSSSVARVYDLRNLGNADLSSLIFQLSGYDVGDFQITTPSTNTLSAGGITNFSVSFSPTTSGNKTAQLSITSNDTNNSPFIVNLAGFGLGENLDSDGDTLNDAAEFTMSALGFNWQISQPSLVSSLFDNASRAGLYTSNNVTTNAAAFGLYTATEYAAHFEAGRTAGQADATTNPSAFNLFTQSQFNGNRTAGQQDVIASPMAFGLYDSNSIMDLRMGGLMVPKAGGVATVTFQPQTTTDLKSHPFTNNGAPITFDLPMPADKGFMRWKAE